MPTASEDLVEMLLGEDPDVVTEVLAGLPDHLVQVVLEALPADEDRHIPSTPMDHAREAEPGFRDRDHLRYLSDRLARAVRDVEGGQNRMVTISMPPRMGKSTMASYHFISWLLRKNPAWKIGMVSHESNFATSWGRQVRRSIEDHPEWGVSLARDLSAASEWETTEGGGVLARGINGSVTGRGFKVLVLDDLVKGTVEAHSEKDREKVWAKWTADLFTRMEEPFLIIAIGTRWHEDDFLGRLLSDEYEGDPVDWEQIVFPALAEVDDVLGRAPGEPLLSPLVDEDQVGALSRWEKLRRAVGSYMWSALYQQRPAPAAGSIFNGSWARYWTTDPDLHAREESRAPGRTVLLDLDTVTGRVIDSWDMTFKATSSSDYVVGQRWLHQGAGRYLIAQKRGRWTFTQTLAEVRPWCGLTPSPDDPEGTLVVQAPLGDKVSERLIEDKANGTAILDTLREQGMDRLIPINPTESKEARARSVTPYWEAGNVFLPHPDETGHEWVRDDFLPEVLSFPHGAHDDQVDPMTQALHRLRDVGSASVSQPRGVVKRSNSLMGRSLRR